VTWPFLAIEPFCTEEFRDFVFNVVKPVFDLHHDPTGAPAVDTSGVPDPATREALQELVREQQPLASKLASLEQQVSILADKLPTKEELVDLLRSAWVDVQAAGQAGVGAAASGTSASAAGAGAAVGSSSSSSSSSTSSTVVLPPKLQACVGLRLPTLEQLKTLPTAWKLLTEGAHRWPPLSTLFNEQVPRCRKKW